MQQRYPPSQGMEVNQIWFQMLQKNPKFRCTIRVSRPVQFFDIVYSIGYSISENSRVVVHIAVLLRTRCSNNSLDALVLLSFAKILDINFCSANRVWKITKRYMENIIIRLQAYTKRRSLE